MFLKRMFYASASVLMLAAAYHLGAESATAQSGGAMEGATIQNPPYGYLTATFTVNRVLYMSQQNAAGNWYPIPAAPVTGVPVPGTAAIVATSQNAVLLNDFQ